MNTKYLMKQGLSNAGKGAQTGAAIGGMLGTVLPGVGNVLGAAGGAVAGAGIGNAVTAYQMLTNPNGATYQPQTAIFAKYGAELEKRETVLRPDGNMLSFNGPTHAQGGIGYNPKFKSEFVFSDSIGFNSQNKLSLTPSKTFAQMSKKFQGKDNISQNTLNMLKQDNKSVLRMFQAPQFKYGGTPKYTNGGPTDPPKWENPYRPNTGAAYAWDKLNFWQDAPAAYNNTYNAPGKIRYYQNYLNEYAPKSMGLHDRFPGGIVPGTGIYGANNLLGGAKGGLGGLTYTPGKDGPTLTATDTSRFGGMSYIPGRDGPTLGTNTATGPYVSRPFAFPNPQEPLTPQGGGGKPKPKGVAKIDPPDFGNPAAPTTLAGNLMQALGNLPLPANSTPPGTPVPTGTTNRFNFNGTNPINLPAGPTSSSPNPLWDWLNANQGINASSLLKVPGTAYNLVKGLQKPEEVPLRLNRQMDDAINLMANRKYDPEAAYQAINRQTSAARAMTQGTSAFLNNAQNQAITNSAQAAYSQANLQGQQMNNQYRGEEARVRSQLGSEERGARAQNDVMELQSKAARNAFLQQSFADMSAIGDAINQGKVTEAQINEGMAILEKTFPNVSPRIRAIHEKLLKGESIEGDDLLILQMATSATMNQFKQ